MDAFELGEAIKEARREQGLTQEQLAKAAHVSRHTIMQLEANAYTDLGIRKVMNVLTALGLSMDVQQAKPQRPTLDEMYEENEREQEAHERQFRRNRPRV